MDIIEIIKVILLGIIEGITEWLPVSSTGHMILFEEFFPLNATEEFKNIFIVVIQLGAIFAVVLMFFEKLWPFKKSENNGIIIKKQTMSLWFKVIFASVPAIIIGLPFDDILETYLMNATVVAIMLIVYGVLFIVVENKKMTITTSDIEKLSYKKAFCIGLFQVLAMIPGTSRSGATILGGIILGNSRKVAAEFSFYLAIPAMFGASALKLVKYFLDGFTFSTNEMITLVLGMTVSFLVSVFVIKFLMDFIKKHDFKVFGYYRIVLGIIILMLL